MFDFSGISLVAQGKIPQKAATLFAQEILSRTGVQPIITSVGKPPFVCFKLCDNGEITDKDTYKIDQQGNSLTITALGIRGLIFGYSFFLRKSEYNGEKITLIKFIGGEYKPDKRIRGHQLGYRTTPNSYDAWDFEDYRRYYLDLMMFGCNTVEHIRDEGKANSLMKYSQRQMLSKASELADEYDLDVSLWCPNHDGETDEQAIEDRREIFEVTPRINAFFPPGGDPGEMEAKDFIDRCILISKTIKKIKPEVEMWPSAQKPHSMPDWGEEFTEAISKLPDEIDGVITGPNRAFTLDELRRRLPMKYPIRLYPDITHNVRCEYPVHFNRDDWHYSFTTALSRECINPRPREYRTIHRLTRRYIVGSVSYSEGVSDDINKIVWSDMDFFPDVSLRETLCDYSRAFFPGIPAQIVADGILGLELNWEGDPVENPNIESTLELWLSLAGSYPDLLKNWRFVQCLFRAKCDALIRRRRIFELSLIEQAKIELLNGSIDYALLILKTDYPNDCRKLREDISLHADELFSMIGLQLDVEHYCANSWERGATLETIDLPITDRAWLLNKLEYALSLEKTEQKGFVKRLLGRNKVESDEFYFSFAEHGFDVLGVAQDVDFYINYQGDRPNVNNGTIPMSMLKLYDHSSFKCKLGGFKPGTDYKLRVTYSSSKYPFLKHFTVTANRKTIYEGSPYGGQTDKGFDKEMLAPGFETATYILPAEVIENGCLDLKISEPIAGVKMSEFWIIKA